MSNLIVEFPNWSKLKEEVDRLKAELPLLILEKDDLILVKCANIKTDYILKLGALEYKAYEIECELLRYKRKIQLIQAKINRQEKINLKDIEITLDVEFAKYQEELKKKIDEVNEALKEDKGRALTTEEISELKKLYTKIVKALHPDLNKDLTDGEKTLFLNAVNAYKNCDLDTLRLINTMIDNHTDTSDLKSNELEEEKTRLQNAINSVLNKIEEVKNSFPYNMKDMLNNKEQVLERKTEIENTINSYKETIESYKERLKELLK